MNIKKNRGVTLLEFLIATTLIPFIIGLGISVFLSGDNLIRNNSSRVSNYTQLISTHIAKYARNAASNYSVTLGPDPSFTIPLGSGDVALQYRVNSGPLDDASIVSMYFFDSSENEMIYYSDITGSPSVISGNIQSCVFTVVGIGLQVDITSVDLEGNTFSLSTYIQPTATAFPAVYTI